MMRYKIIPDDIVKNIIEFLDEIQFEAASSNKPDDLHRINFINWMISELMNGLDGFDLPEENDEDADIDIKQFDSFIDGWDKESKKSNYRDKAKRNGLQKFLTELRIDHELTSEEKFELYYDEYRSLKRQKEGKTLSQTLKTAGVKKPPGNSQTPKK